MENKKKNTGIYLTSVLVVLILFLFVVFLIKFITDTSKETFQVDYIGGIDEFSEKVDKQTEEYKNRMEEIDKKYYDSIKHLE